MPVSSPLTESYLVTGGTGFLGSYIVRALVARGEQNVSVLSLRPPPDSDRVEGVRYYQADIADEAQVLNILTQVAATTVFHTTSPLPGLPSEMYHRINVMGTRALIAVCHAAGVQKLVYTSSTGVVWKNSHFRGVTEEEAKIPVKGYDAYHHTKAIAENLILQEDGVDGLRTVALRPCGILGPRDRRAIVSFARMYAEGRHNIQLGDNTNLVDFVYAGNAADAHLLAADLLPSAGSSPLSTAAPHPVAGQAFFITNGTPRRPYDVIRLIVKGLGDDGSKKIVKIPRGIALVLASISEAWSYVTGGQTRFTRFAVKMAADDNWFSIEKAKRVLGYTPKVSLEDAIRMTVDWWGKKEAAGSTPHPDLDPNSKKVN